MKKILSLILVFSIVLAISSAFLLQVNASTSGIYTYIVSNGKNATITGCDNTASGDISIPSTLGGYPVTSIRVEAFFGCSSLTSITLPNSVTSIGVRAFFCCSSLTSITIPNSVTNIGDGAFYNCRSLTSITIPNRVTSIGDGAFDYCSSLTSITIPGGVTSIGMGAFTDCSSLTSITIPNSVTNIGEFAFSGCRSLTSITIPDSVTSIGMGAFAVCSSLTAITIPNSVTSIGADAFYNCSSLTKITIPNSVTSIGAGAFYNCISLTSITIPSSVTSIGDDHAFYGCYRLTIYGSYGSYAQSYANESVINFVATSYIYPQIETYGFTGNTFSGTANVHNYTATDTNSTVLVALYGADSTILGCKQIDTILKANDDNYIDFGLDVTSVPRSYTVKLFTLNSTANLQPLTDIAIAYN